MSDKFNEVSSEAQRRAEKIKAIRRSIHGEAEVAPTTYENKTEIERTESISDRILRAKEKMQSSAADILDELDAAIAYEKALAAKRAEEAAKAAELSAANAVPDISDLIPELGTPVQAELKEIAEEIAGDFTEFAGTGDPIGDEMPVYGGSVPEDTIPIKTDAEEANDLIYEDQVSDTVYDGTAPGVVYGDEASDIIDEGQAPDVVYEDEAAGVLPADETEPAAEENVPEKKEAATEVFSVPDEKLRTDTAETIDNKAQINPAPAEQAAADAAEVKKKHKKKKSKKSLKQRFIGLFPHKGDSVGECIRKAVFLCSMIAIIICGCRIADYYYDRWTSKTRSWRYMISMRNANLRW